MSRAHLENFSEEDSKKSWRLLETAISKIYEKKYYELSYEELYRNAYYLVLHRYGDVIYTNLQESVQFHLKSYHNRIQQTPESNFLIEINNTWIDIKEMIKAVAQIFLYMDRNYVEQKRLEPIKLLSYRIFVEVFLEDKETLDRFQRQVLGMIRNERESLSIDRFLIKNLLRMLVNIFYTYILITTLDGAWHKGELF